MYVFAGDVEVAPLPIHAAYLFCAILFSTDESSDAWSSDEEDDESTKSVGLDANPATTDPAVLEQAQRFSDPAFCFTAAYRFDSTEAHEVITCIQVFANSLTW